MASSDGKHFGDGHWFVKGDALSNESIGFVFGTMLLHDVAGTSNLQVRNLKLNYFFYSEIPQKR